MKELADANERVQANGAVAQSPEPQKRGERSTQKVGWPTLLAVPFAAAIALALHGFTAASVSPAETLLYTYFLSGLLIAAVFAAAVQPVLSALRKWMRNSCPLIAAAVFCLVVWELVTAVLHWLPLPYFPGPSGVLLSLVNSRSLRRLIKPGER